MARSGLFRNHGAFVLLTFLVLFGGLYSACSAGGDDNQDPPQDSGKRDDAPRSNHAN
jgi:hypothetical protein